MKLDGIRHQPICALVAEFGGYAAADGGRKRGETAQDGETAVAAHQPVPIAFEAPVMAMDAVFAGGRAVQRALQRRPEEAGAVGEGE